MEHTGARILVVDDEPYIGDLLMRWLAAADYEVIVATSGDEALIELQKNEYHLLISDLMMPGMSGVDLLTIVKRLFPDMAVLMVTGVDDRNTAIVTLELGAYGYIVKPFHKNEILINVVGALERRRLYLLSLQYERELESKVLKATDDIRRREEEIVFRLISALGFRDDETGAHIMRVGKCAEEMAKALGWSTEKVAEIRYAAPMHDIGKIGIPDRILQKPRGLSPEEFRIMKRHAEIGAKILDASEISVMQMAKDIAWSHHERHDGTGYPRGLAADQIPEAAAITAVVDVYDALVHKRVYRPAFSEEQALGIMIAGAGEYFGETIFDCFMTLLPVFRLIREETQEAERQDALRICEDVAF